MSRPKPPRLTTHWHGDIVALGTVEACPQCTPRDES